MSPIAYLLDENVDPVLGSELVRRQADILIWRVGTPGSPPKGTSDPDILAWCEERGFVKVTNNRKSMPRHLTDHLAYGHHVPGIILLNLNLGLRETIEDLQLIWETGSEIAYRDQLVFLPL